MTRIFSAKRSVEGTGDAWPCDCIMATLQTRIGPLRLPTQGCVSAGGSLLWGAGSGRPGRQTLAGEGGREPPTRESESETTLQTQNAGPRRGRCDGDVGVAQERSGRRRVPPARRPWSPAEEPRACASPGTGWLRRSQEGEWDFFQPRKPSPPPRDFGSHPRGRDRWPAPLRGSISAARRPRRTPHGCRFRTALERGVEGGDRAGGDG